jgi:FKBP-type peptidyl-prolyl cis-trans isomerase FklB
MKLKVLSIALVAGVMSLVSCTEKKVDKNMALQNEMDSVGYSLGVNFGTNLKRSNINEIDEAAFLAGLYATLDGDSLKISAQASNGVINNHLRRLMQLEGEENRANGEKYLSENGKKEGVVTTASGLQYKVLKEGNGEKIQEVSDRVKVHYRGTFIDGKEFDSSYSRNQPAVFAANQVIKGWTEALQLMSVGAKYELYIPYNLAYGAQGRPGSIPPSSTLVFEVELLEIVK